MPFTAYLYVKTEKGEIKGFTSEEDKTFDGKSLANLSRVQEIQHAVNIDAHPQTGEPQGTAKHKPMHVVIEPDCSVAELYKAMAENQRVDEVKIYFFRSGSGARAGGKPDQLFHNWFTTTLTDARIVAMEMVKSSSAVPESEVPLVDTLVSIKFTYRKIAWDDHDDSKSAEFDWKKKAG